MLRLEAEERVGRFERARVYAEVAEEDAAYEASVKAVQRAAR